MNNNSYKHGLSRTKIYNKWNFMMAKCYKKRSEAYPRYGMKGIKVCERWHDPMKFYEDVGDPPENCSFRRINKAGDFSPENCYWHKHAKK